MISYKKKRKYKYLLHSEVLYRTGIQVPSPATLGPLEIETDGTLTIRPGYSWDGPSGPAIDTRKLMRGSLIHDALYQLMREEILDQHHRKRSDEILRDVCLENRMSRFAAQCVFWAVRIGGAGAAKPDMLTAP